MPVTLACDVYGTLLKHDGYRRPVAPAHGPGGDPVRHPLAGEATGVFLPPRTHGGLPGLCGLHPPGPGLLLQELEQPLDPTARKT